MIRKALEKDINSILRITKACATFMIKNGIFQWNEHYPNYEAFKADIERNELFVLEVDKNIVGSIIISTLMDEIYKPVQWLTPNNNNHIYIHRLAVHPKYQGKGFAQQLIDYAENYAHKNNYTSIRLDTFSQNPRNLKFYELRGYQKLEEIYFPKQSEHPFYCYELILKN